MGDYDFPNKELSNEQYIVPKQQTYMNRKSNRQILCSCGLFLSLAAIAILVVQIILMNVVNRFFPDFSQSDWFDLTVTAIGMLGGGLPLFYILMKRLPNSERGEVQKLSLGSFFGYFFVCVAAMYLSNMVGVVINLLIGAMTGTEVANPIVDIILNSNLLITVLYASILGPIAEELIFRKILLDKLRRFGDVPAILLTSIAFGLYHMNLSQFFYATTVGLILAYLTLRTNTIKYAILIHMMLNFIGSGLSVLLISSNNIVSMALLSLWIYASIFIGIGLFIKNIKKIQLYKVEVPLVYKRDYILNLGTMIFIIICMAMTVVAVIM